jgi:hypothetical protein
MAHVGILQPLVILYCWTQSLARVQPARASHLTCFHSQVTLHVCRLRGSFETLSVSEYAAFRARSVSPQFSSIVSNSHAPHCIGLLVRY